MQVKLEQVFYGRGQFGYAVLGTSPNGKAFGAAVEPLCESIGSPDAFLTWEPFLVNRRFGDYCLMCRVQPGEPDSCGRPTLLYHVLIGLAAEMVAAGLDAFVLQEVGFFRKDVVEHPESVSVEGRSQKRLEKRPFDIQFPAVVFVSVPAPDLIRGLLCADSVRRSWATFAFHPMSGFDLYALNKRASLPTDVACYDSNGKLLSALKSADRERGKQMPISKKSPLLGMLLVINAILLVACVFLFSRNPSPQPQEGRAQAVADESLRRQVDDLKKTNERIATTNAQLEAEVNRLRNELEQRGNAAIGLVSREDVIKELRETFSSQYHGRQQKELTKDRHPPKDIDAYNPYVRFINEKILNVSQTK